MANDKKYAYPKGEIVWVGYYTEKHELKFIITSKESRDIYFLYELMDGKFTKLGKDKSPMMLEEKYAVRDRLLMG